MPILSYGRDSWPIREGQSVLDCLLEQGIPVPHSCRSGLCQGCLMRAVDGTPPAAAQKGLRDSLKARNHFLACVCQPTENLAIASLEATTHDNSIPATVRGLELLNAEVMKVVLECHDPLDYRAGQFINLVRDAQLSRSYSLASVPDHDEHLHLHVRRVPQGQASRWVHEELRPGHRVDIRGPAGECFYTDGDKDQGLLLVGTGSGLAPLFGIARDALQRGHSGPIRLFHGSRDRRGLYLMRELRDLARSQPNFDYTPCLSGPEAPHGHARGRVHDIALQETGSLKNWRVYLCGHPEMVKSAKKRAFLAGASMKDIYADAFVVSPPGASDTN
ncbi:FAD-binding oxidoreductase [Methylolobus aquaticus]